MRKTLRLELRALSRVRALPRLMERVEALEARYRAREPVPAIPVRITVHGELLLSRDGNHRLAAARRAGVTHVLVRLDARDAEKLRAVHGAVLP